MKITPRPLDHTDEIDKSRDVAGINKWSRSSRTVGFFMFLLGWFTIPVEVLLRRDFGQRWFTTVNFYTGLLLLAIFATIQLIMQIVWIWLKEIVGALANAVNPFYSEPYPSYIDSLMDKSMLIVMVLYVVLGSYHRFKIWWRSRTNTYLHSFDDGTSRLEPIAGLLMQVLNICAIPFIWCYRLLLPKKQRKDMPTPKLIQDRTAFANTMVEPLTLFILAWFLEGTVSVWLGISTFALAIHANWKETAKLNKILDLRDSMMEAQVMQHMKNKATEPSKKKASKKVAKETPQMVQQETLSYPDVKEIIDALEKERPV